jgi:hypothetical protein
MVFCGKPSGGCYACRKRKTRVRYTSLNRHVLILPASVIRDGALTCIYSAIKGRRGARNVKELGGLVLDTEF